MLTGQVEDLIALRAATLVREQAEVVRMTSEHERHRTATTALEAINHDLRQVHALDRRLQHALLPRRGRLQLERCRVAGAYRPGIRQMLVGGDFADVRPSVEGGLQFVIGDVSGHGPEAAALGITLRAAWGAFISAGLQGPAVMAGLNEVVHRERDDDLLMATVILGRFRPDGGPVEMVIAGHPPPVLESAEPSFLPLDVGRGPLLGFGRDCAWGAAEVDLAGKGLLLYTDGLIEGRGPGAVLGEDGAPALLDAIRRFHRNQEERPLPDVLIADAVLRNAGPLEDDVAILHIRDAGGES
jgi:serine phosphatase RsbU (regulator of sigma subunit)